MFALGLPHSLTLASDQHLHQKRQDVTVTEVYTATLPDVIVYADANGNPTSTAYVNGQTSATPVVAAASSAKNNVVSVYTTAASSAQATSAAAVSSAAPAKSSAAASSASSAASSSSTSSSSSSGSMGLSYSPYSGSLAAGNVGCKTTSQVATDFQSINGYDLVRIYGTDCNQVANVLAAAKAKNMKVFAGVYNIDQVESELQTIIAAANGDWSSFHTIAIGNELVNSGAKTAAQVVAAIGTARTILKAAGYTGKIVTVDTFIAVENNPSLCQASDYAAVNAHAFFDNTCEASNAGTWLLNTMQAVSAACGGKETWITESGWPTAGDSNGVAVPSTANQKAALSSLKSKIGSNLILFTAFNDMWKAAGYLNVEQSWGMLN